MKVALIKDGVVQAVATSAMRPAADSGWQVVDESAVLAIGDRIGVSVDDILEPKVARENFQKAETALGEARVRYETVKAHYEQTMRLRDEAIAASTKVMGDFMQAEAALQSAQRTVEHCTGVYTEKKRAAAAAEESYLKATADREARSAYEKAMAAGRQKAQKEEVAQAVTAKAKGKE